MREPDPAAPRRARFASDRPVARRVPSVRPRPVDTDGDTIPDERDHCPNEPENFNTHRDDDGCPDAVCRPMPKPGKVEIRAKIYFPSGVHRLQKASHQVLMRIAKALTKHPGILRVEIQGHEDRSERWRGRHRAVSLSKRRAKAVRRFLIRLGVAAERFVARGYGALRPVARNSTSRGRARNRRVGFVILKHK